MAKITIEDITKMRVRQMIEDARKNVDAGLVAVNEGLVNLKPIPKVDYTSIVSELVEELKEHLKVAGAAQEMADEHWLASGRILKRLKQMKPEGVTWEAYVRREADLSQQRADELIRIAEGRTTVDKVREGKRQSVKKSRASKSTLRSVGKKTKARGSQKRAPSACEIDWEHYKDDEEEADSVTNLRAADWQLHEGARLAEEFALLRPGTKASDIKNKHVEAVMTISRKWKRLAATLLDKQGGK
jgi:hypothetical protein